MCLFSSKFQIMDGTFIMFVWYPRYTSQVCSKIKLTGNSNSILTALLLNCASSKLCSLYCIFNLLSLFASGDQIKQSSLIHSSPELLLTEKKCSKPKGLNCRILYKCIMYYLGEIYIHEMKEMSKKIFISGYLCFLLILSLI